MKRCYNVTCLVMLHYNIACMDCVGVRHPDCMDCRHVATYNQGQINWNLVDCRDCFT